MKYALMLLLFIISVAITTAQENPPLLIAQAGTITELRLPREMVSRQWCATEIPDTESATFAPDGRALVYRVHPPFWEEAIRRTGIPPSFGITDIIICQPQSAADIVIAQPENTSLFVTDVDDVYFDRSRVTWSPDSSQIAWVETAAGQSDKPELIIFTLETGETTRQPFPLLRQTGPRFPTPIIWTTFGFVAEGVNEEGVFFALFDAETDALQTVALSRALVDDGIKFVVPITTDTPEDKVIAFRVIGGGWLMLDFGPGTVTPLADGQLVQVVHAENPEGLGIAFVDASDQGGVGLRLAYEKDTPFVVQVDPSFPPAYPTDFRQAVASNHNSIAWPDHDKIIIIDSDLRRSSIQGFKWRGLSLWWGNQMYRIVTAQP